MKLHAFSKMILSNNVYIDGKQCYLLALIGRKGLKKGVQNIGEFILLNTSVTFTGIQ